MADVKEIKIPDLSGATDVDVIEVHIKSGDTVKVEDPLLTLEGDKASMDVPSPYEGQIKSIKVSEGDKVNEGDVIGTIETEKATAEEEQAEAAEEESAKTEEAPKKEKEEETKEAPAKEPAEEEEAEEEPPEKAPEKEAEAPSEPEEAEPEVHAGPAVRRMAKEFGVKLSEIRGSGPKGRIVKSDIQSYVKQKLSESRGAPTAEIGEVPQEDYSQFGETERHTLNKIKQITATNVHRSWVNIPHVTQFDEADITELESFRQAQKGKASERGIRLTPLAFIMKACVASLKQYPNFNSSLAPNGDDLIVKKYYHLGVAVDTPKGLVVPVIRDVDQKGVFELAEELGTISKKAREKGLSPGEMQGASFTISSLGGIGGTGFTPIVNAPQVAILGVAKAEMKPVYQAGEFVPRLILPFSLSYDHRVIDGAEGVRFTQDLATRLSDIRTLLL